MPKMSPWMASLLAAGLTATACSTTRTIPAVEQGSPAEYALGGVEVRLDLGGHLVDHLDLE